MKDLSKKQAVILLVGLFLALALLRSYLALSTPSLADGESYHLLEQVSLLQEHGAPQFTNTFSHRPGHFYLPGYHYLLAFFGMFLPLIFVLKVIPNILLASFVFPLYFLIHTLTKSRHIALLASFCAAFIPLLWTIINTASVVHFVIPLFLWIMYAFVRIKEKRFQTLYFSTLALLLLTHPSLLLLLVGFLVYLVIMKSEKVALPVAHLEIILFSVFLVLWSYLVLFKKLFLEHGLSFIWLNLPPQLLTDIFARFSILDGIYQIGLLPFFAGIFSVYYFIFRRNYPQVYLLIACAMSIAVAIWFGFFPLKEGLILLGIFFVLLASFSYKTFLHYCEQTKVQYASHFFTGIVLLIFCLTSIIPSFHIAYASLEQGVTPQELKTLSFLRNGTPQSAIVFGDIQDGYLITSLAHRRNIIEPNFLLVSDAAERYQDMKRILATPQAQEAYLLLDKYGVDYVYISPHIIFNPDANILKFDEYPKCFQKVYEGHYPVYYLACGVSDV